MRSPSTTTRVKAHKATKTQHSHKQIQLLNFFLKRGTAEGALWIVGIPVSGTRIPESATQLSRKPQAAPSYTLLSRRETRPCVINFRNEARTSVYTTTESLQSMLQTSTNEPHFPDNSKFESTTAEESMWQK